MKKVFSFLVLALFLPAAVYAACGVGTMYVATTAPTVEVGYSTVQTLGTNYLRVDETGGNRLMISMWAADRDDVSRRIAETCKDMAITARTDKTNLKFSFGYFGSDSSVVSANGSGCQVNVNNSSLRELRCILGE